MSARGPAWAQSTQSLDGLAQELARLQQEVQSKNREIGALVEAYEKKGGTLPTGLGPNLTDEQRAMLAKRYQQERLGVGSMLQDILDRDREISGLQRRINEIEAVLPIGIVAKPGDTHQSLVRAFLTTRGVSPADATRLLSTVSLDPAVVPGNKVWILFRSGQFGTWVTAGDSRLNARPAPAPSGALVAQRDAAVRKARSLELAMQESDRERTELKRESAVLRADIGLWASEAEMMRQLAKAAVTAAHFVVGSRDQLRDQGIIAGNWIKGTRLQRLEGLEMLDLTQHAEIVLSAADHGLPRIEKVELLPGGFVADQDYAVQVLEGGAAARLALLDIDKFKSSAFVIVLE
jgi:hypothetical protein